MKRSLVVMLFVLSVPLLLSSGCGSKKDTAASPQRAPRPSPTIAELKAIYTECLPDHIMDLLKIDLSQLDIKVPLKYQIAVEGDDVFLGIDLDGHQYKLLDLKKAILFSEIGETKVAIPLAISSDALTKDTYYQYVFLVYNFIDGKDKVYYYSGAVSKKEASSLSPYALGSNLLIWYNFEKFNGHDLNSIYGDGVGESDGVPSGKQGWLEGKKGVFFPCLYVPQTKLELVKINK
ncbi:MAG: hypothetical protein LBJ79_02830 [Endomicrobium sp.]|jgi:hypothetical protein|nr:hypothetical protein [Endomicrobium sp.]